MEDIKKKRVVLLQRFMNEPKENTFEIGVDEVGRGPLFGRVYASAVVLPTEPTDFDFSLMKDSKKFTSVKKIKQVAQYIKDNALYWSINYKEAQFVDEVNILKASQMAMHASIRDVLEQINQSKKTTTNIPTNIQLLIDGNYFMPFVSTTPVNLLINTIVGGDNKYASIAAASILAKVERDAYIEQLCIEQPTLSTYYGIDKNKGYGTKQHLEGIQTYGITPWHRKTFGPCKQV